MQIMRPGNALYTARFPGGSTSTRIFVPAINGTNVMVSDMIAKKGEKFEDIVYPTDETVRVITGLVRVLTKNSGWEIGAGSTYFIPAGEHFGFEALEDSTLLCFWSPTPGGPLPVDTHQPE